jgi:hypothetical protein
MDPRERRRFIVAIAWLFLLPVVAWSEPPIYVDAARDLEWKVGPDQDITHEEALWYIEDINRKNGRWRMPTAVELAVLYRKGSGARNLPEELPTSGWIVWADEIRGKISASAFSYMEGRKVWRTRAIGGGCRVFAVRPRGAGASDADAPAPPTFATVVPDEGVQKKLASDNWEEIPGDIRVFGVNVTGGMPKSFGLHNPPKGIKPGMAFPVRSSVGVGGVVKLKGAERPRCGLCEDAVLTFERTSLADGTYLAFADQPAKSSVDFGVPPSEIEDRRYAIQKFLERELRWQQVKLEEVILFRNGGVYALVLAESADANGPRVSSLRLDLSRAKIQVLRNDPGRSWQALADIDRDGKPEIVRTFSRECCDELQNNLQYMDF